MKPTALSLAKQELVMSHRLSALKIARSMLRRWNIFLDVSEVQSIADMALCEAIRNFDESRGTRFVTYLFPFVKGALIAEIKASQKQSSAAHSSAEDLQVSPDSVHESGSAMAGSAEAVADESLSPEYLTYRKELRVICRKALESLQPLERETMIEVEILEDKVAKFARRIGYSRPYLSSVRSRAIDKMQPFFDMAA